MCKDITVGVERPQYRTKTTYFPFTQTAAQKV